MSVPTYARRKFLSLMVATPVWGSALIAAAEAHSQALITKSGAIADDSTVNTKAIQAAIDQLAAKGGGTVVVPQGVFVSGALFFKPKVNLRLTKAPSSGAPPTSPTSPSSAPASKATSWSSFNPAFINATNCDGFQLTGDGTLDGAGMPDLGGSSGRARAADQGNFTNTGLPRARLALIEGSQGRQDRRHHLQGFAVLELPSLQQRRRPRA